MKPLLGQEKLDGFAIESYEGKFAAKGFDIPNEMGQRLAYGDEVLMVVQARLKPAAFKEDNNGELKRVHTFEVNESSIVVDGKTWDEIEKIVGVVGTAGQTRLFNPFVRDEAEKPGDGPLKGEADFQVLEVDAETGEITNPNLHERTPEDLAAEHERARARAFEGDGLDDDRSNTDDEEISFDEVVRLTKDPAGSKDPVLRRFLMSSNG